MSFALFEDINVKQILKLKYNNNKLKIQNISTLINITRRGRVDFKLAKVYSQRN